MKYLLMILCLFCIGLPSLSAEIAPKEYRSMQMSAPEHLEITILKSVTRRPLFSRNIQVTLKAEVVSVNESASRLSVGDRITITYAHTRVPKRGWVGPRPIPIQKRGTVTYAFLEFAPESNTYVPAARGTSFDPIIIQ